MFKIDYRNCFLCISIFICFTLFFKPVFCNENTESSSFLPMVINTWAFTNSTAKAWDYLKRNETALRSVVAGCTVCEVEQCDGTVGYGGSPDENGETTLDAMIIDGKTLNMGAVAGLRRVKNAISVALHVLENTQHSILVGELATQFAVEMGFKEESLTTPRSKNIWLSWKHNRCQPNFWMKVIPDSMKQCGPYRPSKVHRSSSNEIDSEGTAQNAFNTHNHDTISMIAIDSDGMIATGTSSNGANHKVPGRVGDAPIIGAGAYADNTIGAAAATGDGDIMMRFLPSFLAVEEMRRGASPEAAARTAILRIHSHYPLFQGALIAVNKAGEYGAACHGWETFPFSVANPTLRYVFPQHVACHKDALNGQQDSQQSQLEL